MEITNAYIVPGEPGGKPSVYSQFKHHDRIKICTLYRVSDGAKAPDVYVVIPWKSLSRTKKRGEAARGSEETCSPQTFSPVCTTLRQNVRVNWYTIRLDFLC